MVLKILVFMVFLALGYGVYLATHLWWAGALVPAAAAVYLFARR
jgi:hypothetical protein